MQDVLISGRGPAGLSAALYVRRANLSVTVLAKDGGALMKAEKIENYFGLERPMSGPELSALGQAQARALGATLLDEEILDLSWDGHFTVTGKGGVYEAKAVILATGASRKTLPIPGLADLEGRGVSYCAVCDGFFYRKKPVFVLGAGEYALHEAQALAGIAEQVTVLTHGAAPEVDFGELPVVTDKLAAVEGEQKVSGVRLADGRVLSGDGLFVALGSAGAVELARKVGAEVESGRIVVDGEMATAVPGLFAAGDCTGGLLQIATAVAGGAKAAMSAIAFLRDAK